MKQYFNFKQEPGKIREAKKEYDRKDPIISVIMPFYNDGEYIEQAVNSILNQTFPHFELCIIDDGSKEESSLQILEKVQKMDDRIRVFHKENEGLAATRDYGVAHSASSSKYLMILDSDDVIDKTFLECAYWTLETNPKASWAYSDSVGFGEVQYLWNKWFQSDRMKKINDLVATSLIRKEDFLAVKGYELREKAVNEDWNFWLKLLAKGKYPVRMNFYGIWYRRKKQGELAKAKQNEQRAKQIIQETSQTITKKVEAIQYPKQDYDWNGIQETIKEMQIPILKEDDKIHLLMIIPWMVTGGADQFNLDLVSGLDKNKFEITIITTEPAINTHRQQFEQYATVYDLTTFLDQDKWVAFLNYILTKERINLILNTNSKFGYAVLPYLKANYPHIPILDYIHMEEWYNRNGGYARDSSAVASVIDKTLVCNGNTKRILEQYFKRNKDDIETVYIGVDETEFNPEKYSKSELRKQYGIPEEGTYVLGYICRITEQKRPYLFLEIIKRLQQERQDFIVLVAGEGNLLPAMKAKAKKLGIAEYIRFLGNVAKPKEVYAMCDMTLNCSIKEGLALTSYESLAMGVPVVSCDVGGQKELINDRVGVIVPCLQAETDLLQFQYKREEIEQYVKAIQKIITTLPEYQKYCRRRIIEGFTIDQMVKHMSQILEETKTYPNSKNIKQGEALKQNEDITKEMINLFFMTDVPEYRWLCDEYNRTYYHSLLDQRGSRLKETLWTIPIWRKLIYFLQKKGMIQALKRVLGR